MAMGMNVVSLTHMRFTLFLLITAYSKLSQISNYILSPV